MVAQDGGRRRRVAHPPGSRKIRREEGESRATNIRIENAVLGVLSRGQVFPLERTPSINTYLSVWSTAVNSLRPFSRP